MATKFRQLQDLFPDSDVVTMIEKDATVLLYDFETGVNVKARYALYSSFIGVFVPVFALFVRTCVCSCGVLLMRCFAFGLHELMVFWALEFFLLVCAFLFVLFVCSASFFSLRR